MTEEAVPNPPECSVVVPAHNEEALLETMVGDLVKAMRDRPWSFEVIVVENGSTDGTPSMASRLAEELPEVRLMTLDKPDYGAASAAGFTASQGRWVVHFDVDYVDMAFLDQAIAILEAGVAGIVLASKRAPGAHDRRPLVRRALTAGFTWAMRLMLRLPVSDAHGIKVLSRVECAPAAAACKMRGALYDVELVLRASRGGVKIAELPASVSELRPPRTPVWRRSIESAVGLLQLRLLLWDEARRGR